MRRFILLFSVFLFLAVLGFFIYFQDGHEALLPAAPKNYLTFSDVVISQLSENQKLWELHVNKAELASDKKQIVLYENDGYIFDKDKKPVFEIRSPAGLIEPGRNQLEFTAPRGSGHIELTGPRLKISGARLVGNGRFRQLSLTGQPVFRYFSAALKNEIVLETPLVEADQLQNLIKMPGPVRMTWGLVTVRAASADYRSARDIFSLFGSVKIDYNNLEVTGDKMTFVPDTEEFVLTGHPVVARRGQEVLRGEQIILSLKNNQMIIKKIGELQINLEEK